MPRGRARWPGRSRRNARPAPPAPGPPTPPPAPEGWETRYRLVASAPAPAARPRRTASTPRRRTPDHPPASATAATPYTGKRGTLRKALASDSRPKPIPARSAPMTVPTPKAPHGTPPPPPPPPPPRGEYKTPPPREKTQPPPATRYRAHRPAPRRNRRPR